MLLRCKHKKVIHQEIASVCCLRKCAVENVVDKMKRKLEKRNDESNSNDE